jgi:hypothetical protein
MMEEKRRKTEKELAILLKRELNEEQRLTLADIERFGWELKFIRRPLFQQSIAVVFDSDRKCFAVLEPDGTLNENPGITIRP